MGLRVEYLNAPKKGETENGDGVFVREDGERFLIAVIDSLGHGPKAAEATRLAVAALTATPLEVSAFDAATRVDEALVGSRGAAAMICVVDGFLLEGCGVGNVGLRVIGSSIPVLSRPGILGKHVRGMTAFSGKVKPGDRLVLSSDGVSTHLDTARIQSLSTKDACIALFERRRDHDDATVLVADVVEGK